MAPKVSKFAKTAAKRKAAPKKTVQKDKTPEKTKKTPEKTKPIEKEPIEEAQKQLQEKMEVDVPETKPVVKVERSKLECPSRIKALLFLLPRRQTMKTRRKHTSITRVWVHMTSRNRTESFSISGVFVFIFNITCHHSYSKPFQEIARMWKTDKSCKWFVSWSKSINNEETSLAKGREGFGTRRYEIVFLCALVVFI